MLSVGRASAEGGNGGDLTGLPFEQLLGMEVVTAAKIARQVSDEPSAVSVVTADDIRAYGYRSLADILNSMRGLYTTYDRAFQYLGGRGFGRPGDFAGRILLMIDGYATNENIYN
jgi:iron complex outermembrane receptor protein